MTERAYLDTPIIKALQSLLTLFRWDDTVYNRAIFTTQPELWDDKALTGEYSTIIDLSNLLNPGKHKPTSRGLGPESLFIGEVTEGLLRAGWPANSIKVGYAVGVDSFSKTIVDVVLFDKNEKLLALFDVKGLRKRQLKSKRHSTREVLVARDSILVLEAAADAFAAFEGKEALWFCIYDGSEYLLLDQTTGNQHVLDHAPSPAELGISDLDLGNPQLLRPDNWESAEDYIVGNELDSVIIDFTLPIGISPTQEEARLVAEILQNEYPKQAYIGVRQALLAWAAADPFVDAISVIAPNGLAAYSGYYQLTQRIVEGREICSVIDLPSSASSPVPGLSTSLLYFDRFEERPNLTYFDTVPARSHLMNLESQPWFHSLKKWMAGEEPSTGYVTTPDPRRPLRYSSQNPELNKARHNLSNLSDATVSLGDICQIFRGVRIERNRDWEVDDGIFVISPSCIREGTIDFGSARKIPPYVAPQNSLIRRGDLLLLYTLSEERPVIVYESDSPAVIAEPVFALRINDGIVDITPEYLSEYLSSSPVRKLVEATNIGARVRQIDRHALFELPVPVLDEHYRSGFIEIQRAQEMLENKAIELRSLSRSLFDARNQAEFQNSFTRVKRAASVATTSVTLSEGIDFQIRALYPYPLAYCYRTLAGLTEPVALYNEQLRAAENILAFVGSIALSMLHKDDRGQSDIDPQSYWRSGISPGDWRDLTIRAVRAQNRYGTHPLFHEIQGLNIGSQRKGFGESIQFLIRAKNDFKHDRGPNAANRDEVEAASQRVQEALDSSMVALGFFTDFPLRMVSSMSVTRTGAFKVHCVQYSGDHPGLQREDLTIDFPPLPDNDVFIDLGSDGWLSLYPFISVATCPFCKTREIYFVDRWDTSRGMATRKSFERGHTEQSAEVAESLGEWRATND